MGPIALFDKSFLQSLSLDEAVWFDHFFLPNISPLFYVETLADLEKEMRGGRTAEQVVGEIASKSPELHGYPNVHHQELLLSDLFGSHISMSNRPVVGGGRSVESDGKKGVNFELSREAKAFSRWRSGEYTELEREFARTWRAHLDVMNFDSSEKLVSRLGIDVKGCKNLKQAYEVADKTVCTSRKPYDVMGFVFNAFDVPRQYHKELIRRYQLLGIPPLSRYAPYAAHLARVEILFHIAVSRGFIGADRPSNKIDIAYLYYLPFCHVFISGDKLHRNTAQYFLNAGQKFVWAQDLKADLARLNTHYMGLPEEVRFKGIRSFAGHPPTDDGFLTAELWDLVSSSWRTPDYGNKAPRSREADEKLVKHLKGFTGAPSLPPEMCRYSENEVECVSMQRKIRRKRGSWYQIPKDFEDG